MEYYSAIKKNEILPFAATWVEPEGIMLSERILSEKDIPYDFTHVEFKKRNMNIGEGKEKLKKYENREANHKRG